LMLEASRVRPPGVEEGASEAGGAPGSWQGRRQERAKVEARAELLRTDGRSCCGRSCSDERTGGAAADGRTELLLGRSCCGRSCCGRTDGAAAGGAAQADRRAELLGRSCCGRSCCGRTGELLRTDVRAELRTPARGAAGAADAGEGDPEASRRRLRERGREQRELEMCRHSVTHSLLSSYPNGPAQGGPNSLAGPNSPSPELVVRLV